MTVVLVPFWRVGLGPVMEDLQAGLVEFDAVGPGHEAAGLVLREVRSANDLGVDQLVHRASDGVLREAEIGGEVSDVGAGLMS